MNQIQQSVQLKPRLGFFIAESSIIALIIISIAFGFGGRLPNMLTILALLLLIMPFLSLIFKPGAVNFGFHLLANISLMILSLGIMFKLESFPGGSLMLMTAVFFWSAFQFVEVLRYATKPEANTLLFPMLLSALAIALSYGLWLLRVLDVVSGTGFSLAVLILNLIVLIVFIVLIISKKGYYYLLIFHLPRLLMAAIVSSNLMPTFGVSAWAIEAFFKLGG